MQNCIGVFYLIVPAQFVIKAICKNIRVKFHSVFVVNVTFYHGIFFSKDNWRTNFVSFVFKNFSRLL